MEYIKCQFLLRELAVVVVVDHPHGEAISFSLDLFFAKGTVSFYSGT